MHMEDEFSRWYDAGLDPARGAGQFFEAIIEAIYAATTPLGGTIVDCGANIGRHTWPMAGVVAAAGKVIAIEAIPTLAQALQAESVRRQLPQVTVVASAVGAAEGTSEFVFVSGADGYSGIRQRSGIPEAMVKTIQKLQVPVETLDHLVERLHLDRVDFIKMDLEGGEYDALRGAAEIMARHQPLIVFENGRAASASTYSYAMADWFGLFRGRGYATFDLFGRPFSEDLWHSTGVPWYFIAARQPLHLDFVAHQLADIVRACHAVPPASGAGPG
jgi:FkbM family methyltransferase